MNKDDLRELAMNRIDAVNRIDELLLKYESKMILTIHDELVFEIKFGEEHLIDEIKKIMESVYSYKRLNDLPK